MKKIVTIWWSDPWSIFGGPWRMKSISWKSGSRRWTVRISIGEKEIVMGSMKVFSYGFYYYPLDMTNSSPWYRWPIEIDGLPMKRMVIFHGELLNNQMVVGYASLFLPPVSSNMAFFRKSTTKNWQMVILCLITRGWGYDGDPRLADDHPNGFLGSFGRQGLDGLLLALLAMFSGKILDFYPWDPKVPIRSSIFFSPNDFGSSFPDRLSLVDEEKTVFPRWSVEIPYATSPLFQPITGCMLPVITIPIIIFFKSSIIPHNPIWKAM